MTTTHSAITTTQALAHIRRRFQDKGIRPPTRNTLCSWFKRGYIVTVEHRRWKQWRTTFDAIDEAIMWHRIPPQRGRPRL